MLAYNMLEKKKKKKQRKKEQYILRGFTNKLLLSVNVVGRVLLFLVLRLFFFDAVTSKRSAGRGRQRTLY